MRRIVPWIAAGLVVALLLLAAATFAVLVGWQRDWVRGQVEVRLTEALGTPVAIEAIDGVLYGEFVLRGLRIGEPDAALVRCASARIDLGGLRLAATPLLTIDAIELSGLRLSLRASDRPWPWEGASTASADRDEAWPLRVRLRSVVVEESSLEWVRDAMNTVSVAIEGELDEARLDEAPAVEGLRLSFRAAGPGPDARPWLYGRARASYAAGRFQLAELRAEGPLLELDAQARGDADAIETAALSLSVPSIEALLHQLTGGPPALSGELDLSASLHGDYGWPLGDLSLQARNLAVRDVFLGDLHVEARSTEAGRLRIDALRLAGGPLEAASDSGADLVADSSATRLEALRLRSGDGQGTLRIDARLPRTATDGDAAIERDPGTRIALRSADWPLASLEPLWTALGLEMQGGLDADLVLVGSRRGPTVRGSAQLERGMLAFGDARARDVDLALELDGPIDAPDVSARGTVAESSFGDYDLGQLDFAVRTQAGRKLEVDRLALRGVLLSLDVVPGASLQLDDSGVRFESFAVESEGQRIALSGGWSAAAADHLRLELDPLDVARTTGLLETFGLLDEAAAPLEGTLEGVLVWNGSRERPELDGRLVWSGARLGEFGFDSVETRLTTEDSDVRIASDWTRQGTTALHVAATLPRDRILAAPGTLLSDERSSAEAQTEQFELGALATFLPKSVSQLAGSLSAELRVRGGREPTLSGNATLERGSVTLAAFAGKPLEPIQTRLHFEDQRLVVEHLEIGRPAAGVRGRGELLLDGVQPRHVDLALDFDTFPLDLPGLVRGTLAGPVALSGPRDALDLTGKLEIADLKVQIVEPEATALKEIQVIAADGDESLEIREGAALDSLLAPLRVDLEVNIARNSWARGLGADVEFRGDVEAHKQRDQPLVLSGTIETVRGTYDIYGRHFRIERGRAVLDGSDEVDPILDVRALHRVRGVRIFAIIEGRLSNPQLRFESIPSLSDTDIASYLLLGRPAGENGDQQPGLDAVAAQIATGAAMREFQQVFGGSLPVDLLDVRVEDDGESSEIRVGVGRYIGDRLFLYYERGFGDQPEDELRAEYQLTPMWSVESNFTTEGETGADLILEIEY